MFREIPGHFKAVTFWVLILVIGIVSWRTHRLSAPAGMAMIILGLFIADQATHLAQPAHFAPAPTWAERVLQRYHWTSAAVGIGLIATGCLIIF